MAPEIKQAISFDRFLNIVTILAAVSIWYVASQAEAIAKDVGERHNQSANAHPQVLVDVATMKSEMAAIRRDVDALHENSMSIELKLDTLSTEQQGFYREMLRRLPND